jgi:hypothetical protein
MTRSIDVERALDAYLAPDRVRVPDRVLEAALDEIDVTPQARRGLLAPQRFPLMNTFARAAAVLVVAVVAIGALALLIGSRGGIGSPPASPIPSAPISTTPLPTLDATFTSTLFGYEIRYPTGWTVRPGNGPWQNNSTLSGPGDPITDEIVSPTSINSMRISIASLALADGLTMYDFRSFASPYSSPFDGNPCEPLAPITGTVMIDAKTSPTASPEKVAAGVSINGCHALAELGGSIYDVEAIAGGRGYEFMIDGSISPADALAWLTSVTLEPASAPAASAAPSPSASK